MQEFNIKVLGVAVEDNSLVRSKLIGTLSCKGTSFWQLVIFAGVQIVVGCSG